MLRMIRPTLIGLVLVDVPVLISIGVLGLVYGFRDTATAYLDWREAHPWSFLVSLAAVALFIAWRRRRARWD